MPAHMAAASAVGDSPAAWYVAYTEPRQENLAVANLQRQGFLTYLPLYKTGKKKSSKSAACGSAPARVGYEPMFPRYMFFKPSSHKQSISTVRSTRGINSIVRFGPNFALVQPDILAAIQEHERQRSREEPGDIGSLEPGCRIRLNDAALNGLEGLVHSVSTQRVIVLMEILGRQTRVKLPQHQVERV